MFQRVFCVNCQSVRFYETQQEALDELTHYNQIDNEKVMVQSNFAQRRRERYLIETVFLNDAISVKRNITSEDFLLVSAFGAKTWGILFYHKEGEESQILSIDQDENNKVVVKFFSSDMVYQYSQVLDVEVKSYFTPKMNDQSSLITITNNEKLVILKVSKQDGKLQFT